jgi:transposase-like protein DUF772
LRKNPSPTQEFADSFFFGESAEGKMRGGFVDQGRLFSYISPEARVPANHPLRAIRALVRDVLTELDRSLSRLYASEGRPSIAPEQLLSALLLQVFYGIRSERQLMEQLDYNLLYRWFVGLSPDDPVWDPTVGGVARLNLPTASRRYRAVTPSSKLIAPAPKLIT